MKHIDRVQQKHGLVGTQDAQKRAFLSEQEILEIQDYFLTPGLHILTVADPQEGRELLERFLDALGTYYSHKAVLSLQDEGMPRKCSDIYKELIASKAVFDYEALHEYVAYSFYYDFLAIEGTHELLNAPWFSRFEKLLHQCAITKTVPVILFFYESL